MYETLTASLSKALSSLGDQDGLSVDTLEECLRRVRSALAAADVNVKVVQEFTDRLRSRSSAAFKVARGEPIQQFFSMLHHELVKLMGQLEARLQFAEEGPTVVVLLGLRGAGKTTTCAKLAQYMRDRNKRRPLLVAGDVMGEARGEQLKLLGRQLRIPVFSNNALTPEELCVQALARARSAGADLVIIDTPGHSEVDQPMMDEVRAITKAAQTRNTVLVLDATRSGQAIAVAKSIYEHVYLSGVILTKLDKHAPLGLVLSFKAVTRKPILFVGTGEELADFDVFSPEQVASCIVRA